MSLLKPSTVEWRKTSRCQGSSTCVEIAVTGRKSVIVRDGKRRIGGPILEFSAAEWSTFVERITSGRFDRL